MIKANELRIGNWVVYEATYHYITAIESGFLRTRWHKQSEDESDYDHFDTEVFPIKLTSEILIKCGFVVTSRDNWKKLYKFKFIELMRIDGNVEQYQLFLGSWLPCIIEHLHQLQNLYYNHTGKELTYTP